MSSRIEVVTRPPLTAAQEKELDAASSVAGKYIRKHGGCEGGGGCLTPAQQRAPEWVEIRDRLTRAMWPDRGAEPAVGAQYCLFDEASS